ncbi:MAG: hypothetical protein MUE30_17960 [Spirosomaceae bacterium]|nr:hypothetical protein [Spirosomataceae bacterium]
MQKIIFALLVLIAASESHAQFSYPKKQTYADLALSAGGGFSGAASYNTLYGVGKSKRFKIGWGVRLTSFVGNNLDYYTAPAKLTSGEYGPQVIFKENILSNIDTLQLTNTQTNALNLVIHLEYSFKRLGLGFNIDALGLTLGGEQSGRFIAKSTGSRLHNTTQTAKPTTLNALLISDNDWGSLNSELYARYWLTDKIGLRAGASFQFTEYTTSRKLTFENDRFRNKILMPFVGVSIKL